MAAVEEAFVCIVKEVVVIDASSKICVDELDLFLWVVGCRGVCFAQYSTFDQVKLHCYWKNERAKWFR